MTYNQDLVKAGRVCISEVKLIGAELSGVELEVGHFVSKKWAA